jgi:RNA polymerase sigma-70 factor (ECF subfamily)
MLAELLPDPEVLGLLALMLLQESRRAARVSEAGDVVLLPDQDQALWDGELIAEGLALCARAFESSRPGPYALQTGIAVLHVQGALRGATDWHEIVRLYDEILVNHPTAVVELNRAAALSMRDGPSAGLAALDGVLAQGELNDYALAHATRADFCRRLGRFEEAREAYTRAIALTSQAAELRFLEGRLLEVARPPAGEF